MCIYIYACLAKVIRSSVNHVSWDLEHNSASHGDKMFLAKNAASVALDQRPDQQISQLVTNSNSLSTDRPPGLQTGSPVTKPDSQV